MADDNADLGQSVMGVAVDIEPRAKDFGAKLAAQVDPQAEAVGRGIGQKVSAPIVRNIASAVVDGVRRGGEEAYAGAHRAGDSAGAEFGRSMKARIEVALKSLPEAKLGADASKIDRELARLRVELAALGQTDVNVLNFDATEKRIEVVRARFSALIRDIEREKAQAGAHAIPIDIDAIPAFAELTRLEREIKQARREAERPIKVKIDAETNDLATTLARLQAELKTLSSGTSDINLIDFAETERRIAILKAQFSALIRDIERQKTEAGRHSIPIDIDAFKAFAEVTHLEHEVKQLRRETERPMRVSVSSGGIGNSGTREVRDLGDEANRSGRLISLLIAIGAGIGPALIPGAAGAAAALGSIGAAAAVGASALGVLFLGFNGVFQAVGLMNKAQNSAGGSAASYASQQNSVADAVRRVAQAQEALKNATLDARDAQINAAQRVADAEHKLRDEEEKLLKAQNDVNDAREKAKRNLEDLQALIDGGVAAEKRAVVELEKAQITLQRTVENKSSKQVERDQADADVATAQANLNEIRRTNTRNAEDKKKADALGVDGSQLVVDAQDKVREAAERVATAQRDVSDAYRAQEAQARHSAASIVAAQESIIQAQQAVQQASQQAGSSGAAGINALERAMNALSPAGQRFAEFLFSLKPIFNQLQSAAQEGLLPGVQRGIEALLPLVPALTNYVSLLAKTMGGLFEESARSLLAPVWREFAAYIASIAVPTISGFVHILLDLAKGFAGLIVALGPVTAQIGAGLLGMAAAFARFGESAGKSTGFQQFVNYVLVNGPVFMGLLGNIIKFVFELLVALAPVGAVVQRALSAVFAFLAGLPDEALIAITLAVAALALAWYILNLSISTTALIVGGIAIGILALGAAFVYAYHHSAVFREALTAVWTGLKEVFFAFYNAVKPTLEQIGADAIWLWEHAFKPALTAIAGFLVQYVGPAIVWLWQNVVVPAFGAIGLIIAIVYAAVRIILIALWWLIVNVIGPVFLWLWEHVISPVWTAIWTIIQIAWAIISIVFGLLEIAVLAIAYAFIWFINVTKPIWTFFWQLIVAGWKIIEPFFHLLGDIWEAYVVPRFRAGMKILGIIWDGLKEIAKAPIKFIIDTVLNHGIIKGYNWIAGKFGAHQVDPIPLPFAEGGAVYGAGTATSDSIPAWLSNGEHVWTAAEVSAAGGHSAVEAIRRSVVAGFATGGPVRGYNDGGGIFDGVASVGKAVLGAISNPIGAIKSIAAGAGNALIGALGDIGRSPFAQMIARLPLLVIDMVASALHFDSGGYLPRGLSLAYNGTGKPEPIMTDDLIRQMGEGRGGSTVHRTTNVYPQRAELDVEQLQAIQRQEDIRDRVGRPG